MRCFFVKSGHIVASEEFVGLTEEEVRARSQSLFATHPMKPERYEVWDRDRMISTFPVVADQSIRPVELSNAS